DDNSAPPGGLPLEGNPGNGIGGEARLVITGGQFSGGNVTLAADGFGGATSTSDLGGQGTGGTATFQALGGSSAPILVDDLLLTASGYGGPGTTGSSSGVAGFVQLATSRPLAVGRDF